MIQNSVGKLYIGITKNPLERVNHHNERRGATFTKYRSDYQIVFLEKYPTLIQARRREIQIKKWRREKKEMLIARYSEGFETKQT